MLKWSFATDAKVADSDDYLAESCGERGGGGLVCLRQKGPPRSPPRGHACRQRRRRRACRPLVSDWSVRQQGARRSLAARTRNRSVGPLSGQGGRSGLAENEVSRPAGEQPQAFQAIGPLCLLSLPPDRRAGGRQDDRFVGK